MWAQGLGSDDPGSSVCRYYARYNIHSAWQADKRSKSATGITHYMLEIDLRTDIVLWITSQILKYISICKRRKDKQEQGKRRWGWIHLESKASGWVWIEKKTFLCFFCFSFQWLMDTWLIYSILILVPLIMRFYRIFCQDLPPVTGHGCQKKWMKIYGETKYCGAMEQKSKPICFFPHSKSSTMKATPTWDQVFSSHYMGITHRIGELAWLLLQNNALWIS